MQTRDHREKSRQHHLPKQENKTRRRVQTRQGNSLTKKRSERPVGATPTVFFAGEPNGREELYTDANENAGTRTTSQRRKRSQKKEERKDRTGADQKNQSKRERPIGANHGVLSQGRHMEERKQTQTEIQEEGARYNTAIKTMGQRSKRSPNR